MKASIGFLIVALGSSLAQAPATEPRTVLLWEKGAPGALGDTGEDRPALTIFRTSGAGGTSVIIAPGGGYRNLSMDHEGREVATWFNRMGVTAYVLQYRLGPRYHHPIELGDAQRAIRLVRSRAAQLGIVSDRIGMMGFSAGGHLTATAGTHFDDGNPNAPDPIDRVSSRPDFLILAYAVISLIRRSRTAALSRVCWGTIQIRNWFRTYPTSCMSRRGRHPRSCSIRMPTLPCPLKTASGSTWRYVKPRFLPRCIFSRTAGTGSDWISTIPARPVADPAFQLAQGTGTADEVAGFASRCRRIWSTRNPPAVPATTPIRIPF